MEKQINKVSEYPQALAEMVEGAKAIANMAETVQGYVVCGFADTTPYCYCGQGRGYQGAPLCPASIRAMVFNTKAQAMAIARSYTGSINGAGNVIKLGVSTARDFFTSLHKDVLVAIEVAKDIINTSNK